ncbi:MAG: hypothetical protein OEU55_13790, partial [Desulfobacterales bacterium]|nr:hypothetical protein [Desulfobacterales bacterium]
DGSNARLKRMEHREIQLAASSGQKEVRGRRSDGRGRTTEGGLERRGDWGTRRLGKDSGWVGG